MDAQELKRRLADYNFYHIIDLGDGIFTPGSRDLTKSQAPVLAAIESLDLAGKRVLDIGCRDGLYSLAAERRGAAEVIGIDNDLSRGAVELVIPHLRSKVRMHELNLYDLTPERFGKFDVVVFAGVLYHLRYPFWGLKVIKDVMQSGGTLIIETAICYGMEKHAMLYCPIGDESPYESTCCTFYNRKGMVDTLSSIGFRTLQTSVLHPDAAAAPRPADELVVDRAVFVCELSGVGGNESVDQYWHGRHDLHRQFGGDRERALASGQFKWKA
jgi:SAM-dependent methyltransferase